MGSTFPGELSFRHLVMDRGAKFEQNENIVTTPTCRKM
jgi:hypothetical protein